MKDSTVLVGFGALGLAYYLSRSRVGAIPTATANPAVPASGLPQGPPAGPSPEGPTKSQIDAITKGVTFTEAGGDALLEGANEWGIGSALFRPQVYDVAAKIPLSWITQKDLNLCQRLVGGILDRNPEYFTPMSRSAIKRADDLAAGKAAIDAIGNLFSWIPVLGPFIKQALNVASNDMQHGIDSIYAGLKKDAAIRIVIDLKQANPTTIMILGNPTTDCLYLKNPHYDYCSLIGAGGTNAMGVRNAMLVEALPAIPNLSVIDPDPNYPHPRLFTLCRDSSGYMLPWLSEELGGSIAPPEKPYYTRISGMDESYAVYIRAVMFRILDVMCSQFFPPMLDPRTGVTDYPKTLARDVKVYTHAGDKLFSSESLTWFNPNDGTYEGLSPPHQVNGIWYGDPNYAADLASAQPHKLDPGKRYSYHNPFFGDIWESIFPPTPGEDTNIVFQGRKITVDGIAMATNAEVLMGYGTPEQRQDPALLAALQAAGDANDRAEQAALKAAGATLGTAQGAAIAAQYGSEELDISPTGYTNGVPAQVGVIAPPVVKATVAAPKQNLAALSRLFG